MCPAWGQTCRACGKENHVEGVCQSKGRVRQGAVWSPEDEEAVMDALIAHMVFDPATNTYKPGQPYQPRGSGSNTYPILSVSGSKTGRWHSLFSSYQTKDLPRQWCNNMPRRDKASETHGNIREELGPLKQRRCARLEDSPWHARAGYPSPSKWEKRPQNRHCTYAEMYRYCTSAKMHAWMWVYCPLAFLSPWHHHPRSSIQ